jgi:hypothetical protein
MDHEQRIEAVRNHSALYDLTLAEYRNVDCKEKAWKEITVKLSQPFKQPFMFETIHCDWLYI